MVWNEVLEQEDIRKEGEVLRKEKEEEVRVKGMGGERAGLEERWGEVEGILAFSIPKVEADYTIHH